MNLLLSEIAAAVEGGLDGPRERIAEGYSIDTRTLKAHDLFFAIRGPRFDGHDFVRQALENHAAAVIVERGRLAPAAIQELRVAAPDAAFIETASPVDALQSLGRYVRRRWGKPIVGVTGSAGKTTTKEAIAAVLAQKFEVLRTIGNLNNEFGMPLCLLGLQDSHQMGVLEMGMSAKGEIRKLAAIAEPNEGVVTNVNPVHLEFFKSVDDIAQAKAELVEGLVAPRRAYLNQDDPRVSAMARKVLGEVIGFGIHAPADFKASHVRDLGLDGTAFTVEARGISRDFVVPLPGAHNVSNALAAIAVGIMNGVSWEQAQAAIGALKAAKMRGETLRFAAGFVAIDDCYNSNPKALSEMIRFLGGLKGFERKIVVAGEMLELGPQSAELHRACGRDAAKSGADFVIAVAGDAREILEGAREAGMDSSRLVFVPDSVAAGEWLARTARKGDAILLKASRGVKLNLALDALRAAFPGLTT